ncbi:MAG: hypothetical protein ACJ798_00370, partial [Phenylobacterium sp.]
RSLLIPREYTRLDRMVDVMFSTAADIETAASESPDLLEPDMGAKVVTATDSKDPREKTPYEFTDSNLLQRKRELILEALSRREGRSLIRKSRALYSSVDHEVRAALTISKRYPNRVLYWYAYHPQWDAFLSEASRSFLVLGSMDLDYALAIPRDVFSPLLGSLNTTTRDGSTYWHIHLVDHDGELSLVRSQGAGVVPLAKYRLPLG